MEDSSKNYWYSQPMGNVTPQISFKASSGNSMGKLLCSLSIHVVVVFSTSPPSTSVSHWTHLKGVCSVLIKDFIDAWLHATPFRNFCYYFLQIKWYWGLEALLSHFMWLLSFALITICVQSKENICSFPGSWF